MAAKAKRYLPFTDSSFMITTARVAFRSPSNDIGPVADSNCFVTAIASRSLVTGRRLGSPKRIGQKLRGIVRESSDGVGFDAEAFPVRHSERMGGGPRPVSRKMVSNVRVPQRSSTDLDEGGSGTPVSGKYRDLKAVRARLSSD